ncbi:MAG: BACON domain-containing protein, partial [bacterium]|nr:BACON domain-containing protein [bacterium]
MRKTALYMIIFLLLAVSPVLPEELPRPTYDNSLIFSMTYPISSSSADSELNYLNSRFGKGLYAPLCITTFNSVEMAWDVNPASAASNIQAFKDKVDTMVQKAVEHGVGLHVTIVYGLSRDTSLYTGAKEEDIRNGMWFSDNNLVGENQFTSDSAGPLRGTTHAGTWKFEYGAAASRQAHDSTAGNGTLNMNAVLATFSRYARKLRNHLSAKVEAGFAYLKQKQEQYPSLLLVVSAPGEAEMNVHPVNTGLMADYFCDFSPFAVLEFRDWIMHGGLYAAGQPYAGQGYSGGGSKYQDESGRLQFNQDFGTAFNTWDLKYYNWSLSDPVDTVYNDGTNPDTSAIPVGQYYFNQMMPAGGSHYITGGFDPPRVMRQKEENAFWDLFMTFRETMVLHQVQDIATLLKNSGLDTSRYYTHQIPADYLFGSSPWEPEFEYLNARYYSSASPLWTADAYSNTGMGITMYDINFGSWYARTTAYVLPEVSALSDNWGAMEYNPEIVPDGYGVTINTVENIYLQFMRVYDASVHFIGFFQWIGTSQNQFKGTNREEAAKQFFDAIRDKARQSISTVFTPKAVESFNGAYSVSGGHVDLTWSEFIWSDLDFFWSDWGDFKEFAIYRGYTTDFQCNASSQIVTLTNNSYRDTGFSTNGITYYKIAAVNTAGEAGTPVSTAVVTGGVGDPKIGLSRDTLHFAAGGSGASTSPQSFSISNTGTGFLSWTVTDNADWLACSPTSGINSRVVNVTVNAAGLAAGTHNASITISDPNADNSPRQVAVTVQVYQSGTDSPPFGTFETPIHGSTIHSSVPFTGWALDDVEVDNVKLYREEDGDLKFIGDALFVEGARPDLEIAFPDYPNNARGGWGYMMLTNFLPGGGNGTYVIHAIAADSEGNETTLGKITVTCDNAAAVDPFGAIDTPAPGATITGTSYRNHGWVLTPLPNCIPTNGSTLSVYIDDIYLGHPDYNIPRSDIAGYFPGY